MRILTCVIAGLTCGCGGGDLDLVPVSGTVTMDGEPLSGAEVRFIPELPAGVDFKDFVAETSTAITGPDGGFQLKATHGGEGALPGKHRVVISRRLMPDGSVVDPDADTGVTCPHERYHCLS